MKRPNFAVRVLAVFIGGLSAVGAAELRTLTSAALIEAYGELIGENAPGCNIGAHD